MTLPSSNKVQVERLRDASSCSRGGTTHAREPTQRVLPHTETIEENFEEETDEDGSLNTKDLEEVTRTVDPCNYDYIPELSDGEAYVPPSQPMLEGTMYPKGRKKNVGVTLSCKNLSTSLKLKTLAEAVEQYQIEGRVILPQPHMRCYRFNHKENGGRPPRMVLSTSLLELGVSSPLHPFIREVCEYFKVAPIQISPNGYRTMIALYIMYDIEEYPRLTAEQLHHFVTMKRAGAKDFGYVYFSVWPEFYKKNLTFGGPSNSGDWKRPYFYIYEVPRVQTHFNVNLGKFLPA